MHDYSLQLEKTEITDVFIATVSRKVFDNYEQKSYWSEMYRILVDKKYLTTVGLEVKEVQYYELSSIELLLRDIKFRSYGACEKCKNVRFLPSATFWFGCPKCNKTLCGDYLASEINYINNWRADEN